MKIYDVDKCKHYNGTVNSCCNAGVNYKSVTQSGVGVAFNRLPCFAKNGLSGLCTEVAYPDEREMAESEAAIAEYVEKMTAVRQEIMAHLTEHGRDRRNTSGFIPCPICDDGRVSFSYAGGYNRHMSAECSNGCVNWVE